MPSGSASAAVPDNQAPLLDTSSTAQASQSGALPSEGSWTKELLTHAFAWLVVPSVVLLLQKGPVHCTIPVTVGLVLLKCLRKCYIFKRRPARSRRPAELPYTCCEVVVDGRKLYVVATMHVAPRSGVDVQKAVESVNPEVIMIELDHERLQNMQQAAAARGRHNHDVKAEMEDTDWQSLTVREDAGSSCRSPTVSKIMAQRAWWNGKHAGQDIGGPLVLQAASSAVPVSSGSIAGSCLLVHPGGARTDALRWHPACQAHVAARAGAIAVLEISSRDRMPSVRRLGALPGIVASLRLWCRTRSCGHPPIPYLMLPRKDGEQLVEKLRDGGSGPLHVEFRIMPDTFPGRSMARHVCQSCCILLSGVGVLYGSLRCLGIEIGGEFAVAQEMAAKRGTPLACIDLDVNNCMGNVLRSLAPTPRRVGAAILAWLRLPREMLQLCWHDRRDESEFDLLGSIVLQLLSFRCRTWFGFMVAGFVASLLLSGLLSLICIGIGEALEAILNNFFTEPAPEGERHPIASFALWALQLMSKQKDANEDALAPSDVLQIALLMYIFPLAGDAIGAQRDQAMSKNIIAVLEKSGAQSAVIVVGALHVRGILRHLRSSHLGGLAASDP